MGFLAKSFLSPNYETTNKAHQLTLEWWRVYCTRVGVLIQNFYKDLLLEHLYEHHDDSKTDCVYSYPTE